MASIAREIHDAIRFEVEAYKPLGATLLFEKHGANKEVAIIGCNGRCKKVCFNTGPSRTNDRRLRSVISEVRHEMRELGIIGRAAAINDGLCAAPSVPSRAREMAEEVFNSHARSKKVGSIGHVMFEAATKPSQDDAPKQEKDMRHQIETPKAAPPKTNGHVEEHGRKKWQMSHEVVVKATMLLVGHGTKEDGDRYTYAEGWDDERVCKEAWPECPNKELFTHLRRTHFGRLPDEVRRARSGDAGADAEAINNKLDAISKRLLDIERRLTSIEDVTTRP